MHRVRLNEASNITEEVDGTYQYGQKDRRNQNTENAFVHHGGS